MFCRCSVFRFLSSLLVIAARLLAGCLGCPSFSLYLLLRSVDGCRFFFVYLRFYVLPYVACYLDAHVLILSLSLMSLSGVGGMQGSWSAASTVLFSFCLLP
jgi:hypothetical protein